VRILGVPSIYPSEAHPELGPFVKALFEAFQGLGVEVRVLAPHSATGALFDSVRGRGRVRSQGEESHVFRPVYWNIPPRFMPLTLKKLGGEINRASFRRVIRRHFAQMEAGSDFVYSSLFVSGWACIDQCERFGLSSIVALDDADLSRYDAAIGRQEFDSTLERFAGLIACSRQIESYIRERCPSLGDRLIYLPIAVDLQRFFRRERAAARQKLGLPLDAPIAVFCGRFVPDKGSQRTLEALKLLHNARGVFLGGGGTQMPKGREVLHAGPIDHDLVPWWLAAGDVFVLPSLHEGMSNAIVEALACGLPVVVSDRPFNRQFLTEECAVFVDPLDPSSIAQGIRSVLSDPHRSRHMSQAALDLASGFDLGTRAKAILSFAQRIKGLAPQPMAGYAPTIGD